MPPRWRGFKWNLQDWTWRKLPILWGQSESATRQDQDQEQPRMVSSSLQPRIDLTADITTTYKPEAGVYDELMGAGGAIQPHWRPFLDALNALGPTARAARYSLAKPRPMLSSSPRTSRISWSAVSPSAAP